MAKRYEPVSATVKAFHQSDAFIRILQGPIGSGKSTACVAEILRRALTTPACKDGIRRSRWAIIRGTYPELKTTTMHTWSMWVPFGQPKQTAPMTHSVRLKEDCELEALFLACEGEEDIKKLKSLEVTGIWFNELGVGIARSIFEEATGRLRYPSEADLPPGQRVWRGIIADTNAPAADHWLWSLYETPEPGIEVFHQPPAVMATPDGRWLVNAQADNLENLREGYYEEAMLGKREEWIRRNLACERVFLSDDMAVFGEQFSQSLHVVQSSHGLAPLRHKDLLVAMDCGLSPAAVVCQLDDRGRLTVFAEATSENMGMTEFVETKLAPLLTDSFSWHQQEGRIRFVIDPAGKARAQTDGRSVIDVLLDKGIRAWPAPTNALQPRLEAVRYFLNRMVGGVPAFRVSPQCTVLIGGLASGYRFKLVRSGSEDVRYHQEPVKNRYSHVVDALGYACTWYKKELKTGELDLPFVDTRPLDSVVGI